MKKLCCILLFNFMLICMFGCGDKYVFIENEIIELSNIVVEISYECVENGSTLEECKNFVDSKLYKIMKEM